MTDYNEEQELELEALEAIFLADYCLKSKDPRRICLKLEPFPGEEEKNHVCINALFEFPATYPDVAPKIEIQALKGLREDQCEELKNKLLEKSHESLGMPMIFTLAESAKEWLEENNKDQTDESMHAKMMAKQEAAQREKEEQEKAEEVKRLRKIEQKQQEMGHLREGTPVTKETFEKWLQEFNEEKYGARKTDEQSKLTGRQWFQQKDPQTGLEMQGSDIIGDGETPEWDAEVNEEDLFLQGEEDDLDDLDDLEEDSSEEETS